MVPKLGTGTTGNRLSLKMAMHRGEGQRGGAMCLRCWAISCCFLVWLCGSLESWSRLRACSA